MIDRATVHRRSMITGSIAAVGAAAIGWRFVQAEGEQGEWGYEGEHGPEHWGGLSEANSACATGTMQSPLDLSSEGAEDVEIPNIELMYEPVSDFTVEDNGHTIRVPISNDSAAALDGRLFKLVEFHFHAPSEHTIDGQHADMELHMVHVRPEQTDEKLVLGVLLMSGEDNQALTDVFNHLPGAPHESVQAAGWIDPSTFIPEDKRSFRYLGSLTTPPCTEGVHWVVFAQPMPISAEQHSRFVERHEGNSRPAREANPGEVVEDVSAD
jgi:carbonic anhydrase